MSGRAKKPDRRAQRSRPAPPKLRRWLNAIRDFPGKLSEPRWRSPEARDPAYVEFQILEAYRLLRSIARDPERIGRRSSRSPSVRGRLTLSRDGKIRVEYNPVLDALLGAEARRIRECANPECQRIYWAGRLDQFCCSTKCAHIMRSRKYREESKAKLKTKRKGRPHGRGKRAA